MQLSSMLCLQDMALQVGGGTMGWRATGATRTAVWGSQSSTGNFPDAFLAAANTLGMEGAAEGNVKGMT